MRFSDASVLPVLLVDHSGAVAAAATLGEERIGLLRRIRVGTFGDRRLVERSERLSFKHEQESFNLVQAWVIICSHV